MGPAMATKPVRFSEVLRAECGGDGPGALASFESWDQLRADYPKVAAELDAEADRRGMKGDAALAMARAALESIVGKAPAKQSKPAGDRPADATPPEDPKSPE